MNTYSVFLSPVAEKKLLLLLDYLEKEWGGKIQKRIFKTAPKSN
jgi:hypothetical protein